MHSLFPVITRSIKIGQIITKEQLLFEHRKIKRYKDLENKTKATHTYTHTKQRE